MKDKMIDKKMESSLIDCLLSINFHILALSLTFPTISKATNSENVDVFCVFYASCRVLQTISTFKDDFSFSNRNYVNELGKYILILPYSFCMSYEHEKEGKIIYFRQMTTYLRQSIDQMAF